MENKSVYRISGSYGKSSGESASGEILVLFGCFIFLLPVIVLTVIDLTNIWFLFAFVSITALFLLVLTKRYYIEYDANWFYLKKLFHKTQKISVADFLEIKKAHILSASVYVVFKDKKVLTTGKYVFNPFNLFMTNKEYNKVHTAEIKSNIEKAKQCIVEYQSP